MLVPICSYQGDHNLLGLEMMELQNMTFCDKFEPTILEGQLCYTLDVAKYTGKTTKRGKTNGLVLLLDSKPYPMKSTNAKVEIHDQEPFKLYIHTLAENIVFGPGAYAMHTLKRMTGKTSFYQMGDRQKECQVHSREKCQTEMFLTQVRKNCSCVPWALSTGNSNTKVSPMIQLV